MTFNALTGTPLARLRHRDKWLLQAQALDQGLSVRKAARQMGVHRTTSFRWRHRFLTLPRDVKEQALTGVAEADETGTAEPPQSPPRCWHWRLAHRRVIS